MLFKRINGFKVIVYTTSIISLLLVIATIGSWYLSYKIKPVLTRELKVLVNNSTDQLYNVEFSDINLNFLTGNATFNDVRIFSNEKRYKKLVEQKKAPDNLYELTLKKLQLRRFHPLKFYFNNEIEVQKLIFHQPSLTMLNKNFVYNRNLRPAPRISPYQFISKFASKLDIQEISLKSVRFKYVDLNGFNPIIDSINNLNIVGKAYLVDENSAQDTSRIYLFKEINFSVSNQSYFTSDDFYNIKFDKLSYTTKSGKLILKGLNVIPLYNEEKFGRIAGFAKDRLTINVNTLEFEQLSLPNFIANQEIIADKLNITSGKIIVHADNRLPQKIRNYVPLFPHQLLQQFPHTINIKETELKDIDVTYSEFDRDSYTKGEIDFFKTSGKFFNITNDSLAKTLNPIANADLTTYLMGSGKLDLKINFYLNSRNGLFDIDGKMGPINGKLLNRITRPIGMMQIASGDVNSLTFNFEATEKIARGKMELKYQDLNLKVLTRDKEGNRLKKNLLASFLINNLVVEESNPTKGSAVRKVDFVNNRNLSASFFNYLWKTLFVGIKSSVGVTPQKELEISNKFETFESIKGYLDNMKSNKEKRQQNKDIKKHLN